MDGLALAAVATELQALVGGRVDRVAQPEPQDILLSLRAGGKVVRLLLSAAPAHSRAHLVEAAPANPPQPHAFCMLLRKRLGGARLLSVTQPDLDRVLRLELEGRSELGDAMAYALVCEIMGKHANIVLVNDEGRVVDAVKRVSLGISSARPVLPGLAYEPPPAQGKHNPFTAAQAVFSAVLSGSGRWDKQLAAGFTGLSGDTARALCTRILGGSAAGPEDAGLLARGLHAFFQEAAAGKFSPALLLGEEGEPVACYPFVPRADPERIRKYPSMSAALEAYYAGRVQSQHQGAKVSALARVVRNNLARLDKKIAIHQQALAGDELLERTRAMGDLITANLHALRRGMREAHLTDYTAVPPHLVRVELDELLSPADNAQRYYKKYRKLRQAQRMAGDMIAAARQERQYLEGQLLNLGKCTTLAEIEELAQELAELGYVKQNKAQGFRRKEGPSRPLHFRSSDGADIYVGKNNRQNDTLTFKAAARAHWWLHAKDVPGSHVIVATEEELAPATLEEAALLAAWYSGARAGSHVPVDYTRRKYVKKSPDARPGAVTYAHQRTVYVTPDAGRVKKLPQIT